MNESLLQYIWRYRYLLNQPLYTTSGEQVQVILPGQLNSDSGPDFFNARIQLGSTTWAGNIEIHIKSSDWKKHRHQHDEAYDNVILHVVLEHDEPVFNRYNEEIPTLELKRLLPEKLLARYSFLQRSRSDIPCGKIFELPPAHITINWLERLATERLEQKSSDIFELLGKTNNHWEQVLYRLTARYFGQKINAVPFELLSQQLPLNMVARNRGSLLQVQALVLGLSGLLGKQPNDDYLALLRREYNALQNKHQLTTMDRSVWKFGKTRPANFPTVRLLQLAGLLYQSYHMFSDLLSAVDLKEAAKLFTVRTDQSFNLQPMHAQPGTPRLTTINTGPLFVNLMLINVAVPVLFSYGKWVQDEVYCSRALSWLNNLDAEINGITKKWAKMAVTAVNAKQSQALITLNNYYCKQHQCLRCAFGNHILNR